MDVRNKGTAQQKTNRIVLTALTKIYFGEGFLFKVMRAELKRLASQLSNNKDFREVYLCAYKNDIQYIGIYGALRQFIKLHNSTNVTIEEFKTYLSNE